MFIFLLFGGILHTGLQRPFSKQSSHCSRIRLELPSRDAQPEPSFLCACQIKAVDNGRPQKSSTVRLHIEWIKKPAPSPVPLTFDEPFYNFTVMESDKVTEMVGVVSVQPSNIPLWFDIVGKSGASTARRTPQKQSIWLCGFESKKTNMNCLSTSPYPSPIKPIFLMMKLKCYFNIVIITVIIIFLLLFWLLS